MIAVFASAAGVGVRDIQEMRFRQVITLGQEHTVVGVFGATSHTVTERCVVTGTGELVFQFAQETSTAAATELRDASFATVQPLREL
ncbi:hypothetical protein [Halostreptopolyspora alba]|uniref:Uncharacterized protein n=1 Tax=Halostreptopolyspora alba TaxID=2487137 RepID=A0A3N0EDT2_9ACTN|nr:hypothetical protein EFW17_07695 [Nocardiopsaceae bacterium YIM 96095]